MNVIITGSTGFIGSHLVPALARDNNNLLLVVRSLKKTNKLKLNLDNTNIKYVVYKQNSKINELINNFKRFKPDLIIHLATCYLNAHQIENIDNLIQSNIIFGTKIIEAGIMAGCKRIINTSTIWEYYLDKKIPVNFYAATKAAFDQILNFYYSAYQLIVINLYLSDTYGEDDHRKKLIPLILKEMFKPNTLQLTSGKQKLELFHIQDIVRLYQQTATKILKIKKPTKVNFFPKGEQFSIRDLILIFKQSTKSPLKFNFFAIPDRPREVFKISKGVSDIKINWKIKNKIAKFFSDQFKLNNEFK